MASGFSSILSIGKGALFASQTALQTVGNNIANVNTEGYSRQAVRLESWPSLDYNPGQLGQGVNAVEVIRYFDKFVERNYLQQNGNYARWAAMSSNMSAVESIFNESSGYGIGSLMSSFFSSWEKLSQFPDDPAGRQALLSNSLTLTESIKAANVSLQKAEERADSMVREQVARANELIETIAQLNKQINIHYEKGHNNPNTLLDERDALVRELSGLIDVDVIDHGAGDYIVNTKGGYTLVDGLVGFELAYEGARAFQTRVEGSVFNGTVGFNGADGFEYAIEFVQGGTLGGDDAKFRVSLDGGRSWVTDEDGNEMHFTARDVDHAVRVKDLEIYFNPGDNNTFVAGDRFTIVPKHALSWVEPTIGPLLITPQEFSNGVVNSQRANGGSIAGNLLFIDYQVGKIRDELDSFAKNFVWEVNRIHSQGAGITGMAYALGDYAVRHTDAPLNSEYVGFPWADRLQAGNFSLAVFDPAGGEAIMFDPGLTNALEINFDPATDSLEDVRNNMRSKSVSWTDAAGVTHTGTLDELLNIDIVDNRLSISGKDGYTFGFADDTTGLLAALGLNTFFKGDQAANIGLNENVAQNINLVNAGRINGGAESNAGDNITAREIGNLVEKKLLFRDWTGLGTSQTIQSYYASVVSQVGSTASVSNFNSSSNLLLTQELADRQSEVAGVNLDEEMTNLIRFQASYKAAAKLITTADEMLQTLLAMKQ
jgi:flagellar hook-associated protein 1 FlgK